MKSEVQITTHKNGTATVIIDGKDLSMNVKSIVFDVDASANIRPTLTVEYGCYEQATIEGQMDVVHVCPKKAR